MLGSWLLRVCILLRDMAISSSIKIWCFLTPKDKCMPGSTLKYCKIMWRFTCLGDLKEKAWWSGVFSHILNYGWNVTIKYFKKLSFLMIFLLNLIVLGQSGDLKNLSPNLPREHFWQIEKIQLIFSQAMWTTRDIPDWSLHQMEYLSADRTDR